MRFALKLYTASCLFLVAFFLFFLLPIDELPIPRPITAMIVGTFALGSFCFHVYRIDRSEGFDLGWFLLNKYGFIWLAVAILGIFLIISGALFWFAPFTIEPAFEKGIWPVAGVFVVLFWLAIIYFFALISLAMTSRMVALFRTGQIKRGIFNVIFSSALAGLATAFFSMFLSVINDNLVRVSENLYSILLWVFLAVLMVGGITLGSIKNPSEFLEEDEETENLEA